jgi:hypothetical protein
MFMESENKVRRPPAWGILSGSGGRRVVSRAATNLTERPFDSPFCPEL